MVADADADADASAADGANVPNSILVSTIKSYHLAYIGVYMYFQVECKSEVTSGMICFTEAHMFPSKNL